MTNGDEGRVKDPCVYCQEGKPKGWEFNDQGGSILTMSRSINALFGFDYDNDNITDSLVIDHRNGTITWDNSSGEYRRIGCKITYCPFCGRLLSNIKENSDG